MDQEMLKFILITFVVISLSLYIAYLIKKTQQSKSYSFKEFLNDGPKMPSLNDIITFVDGFQSDNDEYNVLNDDNENPYSFTN